MAPKKRRQGHNKENADKDAKLEPISIQSIIVIL